VVPSSWQPPGPITLASDTEARAKRQEEWAAFQIQTIADLQEQLDAISPVLGVDTNERELAGVLKAMSSAGGMPAHLVAHSRAMMLCSRLEDMDLAAQIRMWLSETRAAIAGTLGDEFGRLRDERLALQDDLGLALKNITTLTWQSACDDAGRPPAGLPGIVSRLGAA
jgi:hypothetical protein